jgi:hypothetical protein
MTDSVWHDHIHYRICGEQLAVADEIRPVRIGTTFAKRTVLLGEKPFWETKKEIGELMKNISKGMMAGLFAGLIAAPGALLAADAGPAPLSASLDLPVLNAYVWRGQVITDKAVVQPSMTINKGIGPGTLTLNYWQNFNLDDQATGNSMEFSEHDITLSYSGVCPLTGLNYTLGIVNYDFPNQAIQTGNNLSLVNDTREGYLSVGSANCPLAPTLTVYRDFKEANGFYATFGVAHSFEINKAASLSIGASTGAADSDYNTYYFGVDKTKLNDGNVTASLAYKACDSLTITPGIQYTWLWDSAIRDAADTLYHGKDQVVGSLKATYTF